MAQKDKTRRGIFQRFMQALFRHSRRLPTYVSSIRECDRCGRRYDSGPKRSSDGLELTSSFDRSRYCSQECSVKPPNPDLLSLRTRQATRQFFRHKAWEHIQQVAGGERRMNRRLMMHRLAGRWFRDTSRNKKKSTSAPSTCAH